MTVLPPGPEGTSQPGTGSQDRAAALHLQRNVAEGFGADAGRYDRARPTYPADLVERIIAASPGRDVLDVGCGTGISARLFQAAGCRVLGVDPDPRMAELARQGGTETDVSKFEDWDPAARTFDVVISAQAWHWVDPVAGAAKAAAVLRPGGRLAVFWNVFGPPEDLREAFGEVFRRVLPDSGGFLDRPLIDLYRGGWVKMADVIRQAASPGAPRPSSRNSSQASVPPSTRRAVPSPCPTRRSPAPPPGWPLNRRLSFDDRAPRPAGQNELHGASHGVY
jgi:SAM-dependent methyltransferase